MADQQTSNLIAQSIGPFSSLSYFEGNVNIGGSNMFIGAYQCPKSVSITSDQIQTLKSLCFNCTPIFEQATLENFNMLLDALKFANLSIRTQLIDWIIPVNFRTGEYDSKKIVDHWNTAYIASVLPREREVVITIKSSVYPESTTLYVRSTSLEQNAVDTIFIPFIVKDPLILGRIRTNDDVRSMIEQDNIIVYHLINYKKPVCAVIDGILFDSDVQGIIIGGGEHREKSDGTIAETTIRVLEEELIGNIRELLPTFKFKTVNCGIHDVPGRDVRYWPFEYNGIIFGYKRRSLTELHVIVAMVSTDNMTNLNCLPSDLTEVSKSKCVRHTFVREQFNMVGKLKPAFPSHVDFFEMFPMDKLVNAITDLISN